MLVLLENLVLHSIDALDAQAYARLRTVEPRLQQTFGQPLSWSEIVKAQLDLPPEFEDQVRDQWAKANAVAKERGIEPNAIQFAQAVAERVGGRGQTAS